MKVVIRVGRGSAGDVETTAVSSVVVREWNMKTPVLFASTLVASTLAILVAPLAVRAEQPPIIDRNLFFGEAEISGEQISPDGQFISFLKPYKGTRNIWVKTISEPFSAARPISAELKRPVGRYFWSRDSKFILYSQDAGGDENFNVHAIDPRLAADPATGVPPARALTNLQGVRTLIYSVPRTKPDIIYIGLNDRDARWHDLYELHLSTGEKTLLRKNTERITSWVFDHDATLRLAERVTEAGDNELLRVDPDGFKVINRCDVLESCSQAGFDAQNRLVYLVTNKGPLNLTELNMLDPATGATTPVESDPQKRVDFGGVILSAADDRVLFTQYRDDGVRRHFKDHAFEAQFRWLESQFPGKEVDLGARTADESLWIVNVLGDTEPGETYVWNPTAQTLALQYRVHEELSRAALSERRPYHYKSSDGLDIPAYLTLPKGLPAQNLPLIVNPHGGPWTQEAFGYNRFAQFLANRGYAVLQPNFRGSAGYGKAYLNAGNGEWGRKMQDDLTWGVKALVADGTVDPKRVGIAGASYGGYATLAGVAFTPDIYAVAVDIMGPANLVTQLDKRPAYWEFGKKLWYTRVADPTTEQGEALLIAESPLTRANAIVTPLMVVQGKNDPRVDIRESNQIVAAVRDNGKPVEYLVAPDEGHGFVRPINTLAMVSAMEPFLAKYLGGRCQEDVPADVATRLKEITVDPRTVNGTVALKQPDALPSK
jgi:dipeptidyl aminopeptidase/acylaminoacyl peptidase